MCCESRAAADLRDQLVAAHDGAGDQMREEGEVHGDVEQPRGLDLVPRDVDDVADGHERVERDPDRQDHLQQRQWRRHPEVLERVREAEREEAVVLEPRQRQQQGGHDDEGPPSPASVAIAALDPPGAGPRQQAHQREEPHEADVPPRVEDVARREGEPLPRGPLPVQQPADREHDREEDREVGGGKEHRLCRGPVVDHRSVFGRPWVRTLG